MISATTQASMCLSAFASPGDVAFPNAMRTDQLPPEIYDPEGCGYDEQLFQAERTYRSGRLIDTGLVTDATIHFERNKLAEWHEFFGSRAYRRYGIEVLASPWSGSPGKIAYPNLRRLHHAMDLSGRVLIETGRIADAIHQMAFVAFVTRRHWACCFSRLLIRTGYTLLRPERLTTWMLQRPRDEDESDTALSCLAIAYAHISDSAMDDADDMLLKSIPVLHKNRYGFEVCIAALAAAQMAFLKSDYAEAHAISDLLVEVAQHNGYQLVTAEAFLLRATAKIRLSADARISRDASDSVAETLQVAERCGWVWVAKKAESALGASFGQPGTVPANQRSNAGSVSLLRVQFPTPDVIHRKLADGVEDAYQVERQCRRIAAETESTDIFEKTGIMLNTNGKNLPPQPD